LSRRSIPARRPCHGIGGRKIYRSTRPRLDRQPCPSARGLSEYLPPETILFDGARLRRRTTLD
jgi:hypothetical protein